MRQFSLVHSGSRPEPRVPGTSNFPEISTATAVLLLPQRRFPCAQKENTDHHTLRQQAVGVSRDNTQPIKQLEISVHNLTHLSPTMSTSLEESGISHQIQRQTQVQTSHAECVKPGNKAEANSWIQGTANIF